MLLDLTILHMLLLSSRIVKKCGIGTFECESRGKMQWEIQRRKYHQISQLGVGDKIMKGGKRGENQKHSDESVDSDEKRRTDPETPDRSSPPLFSVPAAASIGRVAAESSESPARNTRMASRKAEVAEKGHQKRRKT